MGTIGVWQIVIVVLLLVLLFGRGKISELMGDVAKGIKSFKKGMSDDQAEASEPVKTLEHGEADDAGKTAKSSSGSKAKAG
ncbi:MAG: twin-arginine translocase TatA/TatE family subunit [Hyphomicrobiaceae bacterium]|nr:twin-arginine translocase TatA/TatE family subunit [Hyphomicrobiaceae bacterium]